MGKEIEWGEAVDLVEQLQLDMGSHLFMSLVGWSYPMTRSELATVLLTARVFNALKGKDDPPFAWEWPWPETPAADAVTDDERAKATSTLKANSAFGQLRT